MRCVFSLLGATEWVRGQCIHLTLWGSHEQDTRGVLSDEWTVFMIPRLVLTWAECRVTITLPLHVNVCFEGDSACWPWNPGSSSHFSTAVVTNTSQAQTIVFIPRILFLHSSLPSAACGLWSKHEHTPTHKTSLIVQPKQYKQSVFVSLSACLVLVLLDKLVL